MACNMLLVINTEVISNLKHKGMIYYEGEYHDSRTDNELLQIRDNVSL